MAKKRKAGRKRLLALMLCIMTGLSLIAGGSYSKAQDQYSTTSDGIRYYYYGYGDEDVYIVGYNGNNMEKSVADGHEIKWLRGRESNKKE